MSQEPQTNRVISVQELIPKKQLGMKMKFICKDIYFSITYNGEKLETK